MTVIKSQEKHLIQVLSQTANLCFLISLHPGSFYIHIAEWGGISSLKFWGKNDKLEVQKK